MIIKKYCPLFCLLFINILFSAICTAQFTVAGRVVDDETSQPIAGASVYFNNTSIGTATNAKGEFQFAELNIPNTELVVSCIGYEVLAHRITASDDNGKHFLFRLQKKQQQLKEVLVLTKDNRKKWLELFRDNFLGLTEEGKRCRILNEESIYFTSGNKKNSFNAYADTALVIKNEMLGYTIYFQLAEFSYDETERVTYFYGYTRYEEMGSKKKWIKRRKNCYYGSTLHFYRSLITDKLKEEGYVIALRKKIEPNPADSLQRPGYVMQPLTASELATRYNADTGFWRLNCEADVLVRYRRSSSYLMFPVSNGSMNPSIDAGTNAGIRPRKPLILVDNYGILEDPLSVSHFGYWTYEKVGNMLPYNYYPNK